MTFPTNVQVAPAVRPSDVVAHMRNRRWALTPSKRVEFGATAGTPQPVKELLTLGALNQPESAHAQPGLLGADAGSIY
jgi:hypothetical protein